MFHSAPSCMSFLRALSLLFLVPLSSLCLQFSRFCYFTILIFKYLQHITIQISFDAHLKFYLNKCHNYVDIITVNATVGEFHSSSEPAAAAFRAFSFLEIGVFTANYRNRRRSILRGRFRANAAPRWQRESIAATLALTRIACATDGLISFGIII